MEELDLDYRPFVREMQESLQRQGLMQPVNLTRFVEKLDFQIDVHREVYINELRQNWDREFPGLAFSEELLEQEADKLLAKARSHALIRFQQAVVAEVKKEKKYKILHGWIFRKWDLWFITAILVSFFLTMPFFLHMFFAPSDLKLAGGGIGIVVNLVGLSFVLSKALKSWRS